MKITEIMAIFTTIIALFAACAGLIVSITNLIKIIRSTKQGNYEKMNFEKDVSFFTTMNKFINIDLKKLPINDRAKQEMTQDIALMKFVIFRNEYKDLAKRLNTKELSLTTFISFEFQEEVVSKCEDEYKKQCENSKIPKLFIEKFQKWQMKHYEKILEDLKKYCIVGDFVKSKFFTPVARYLAIMNVIESMFFSTIIDLEQTANEINGDLAGIEYNGFVCESPHQYKNFVTKEEFQISEKIQNIALKDLIDK